MNEDIIPDKVFYMDRTDTDNIKPYAYIEWFSWMVGLKIVLLDVNQLPITMTDLELTRGWELEMC